MRIQLVKLGVLILAAGFSVTGVLAQQQSPNQSSQDQQQNQNQNQQQNQNQPQNQDQQQPQDQQQNQNQGNQQQQTPDQGQPQQPIPAYRSPLGGATDNEQENPGPQYEPDSRPLSGVQDLSVIPAERRSYWSPYLGVLATGDSNSLGATKSGWVSYESVIGGVNLERASRGSELALQYIGGGTFSTGSGIGTSVVQDLGVTETIHGRRNSLTLVDLVGYFPETSFGFGGTVGLPGLTSTTGGINPVFLPGESILTAQGQRLSNASIAQFDMKITARSSFTVVGGYSFLHFLDNNLLDYSDINARAGYNYEMTRHDTIALYYDFAQLRYSAISSTIENHTLHVSYAHRVTGRLAFQAAAGPEISFFPDSVLPGGSPTNSTTRVSWSMNTGLTYQEQERTSLGIRYSHGVTGGSGIFFGAESDRVSGTIDHRMQGMDVRLTGGYSRNRGLNVPGVTSSGQVYNYWFGGANLDKPLLREWSLRLSYELQYQYSNLAFCITPQCRTSFTRNVISLGVYWKGRPTPF